MHLLSGSLSVCLYGRIWWGLVALKALSNKQKWRIERNVYPVIANTIPTGPAISPTLKLLQGAGL